MKNTLSLIVLSLITSISFAKKGFSPGTLILRTGDTLNTEISLGNFKDLRQIYALDGKKKVKYKPGEIVSVQIGDVKYVSQPLRLFSIKEEFNNDGYVLLEELVKGQISLYKLDYCFKYSVSKDPRARGNMTQCNTRLYLLSDIKPYYYEALAYDDTKDAMSLIKKKKQLHSLNELAGYFQACEKVSKAILYEQIKRENIFDAVMQYNECMEKSKQNTSEENTPDNPSSEKSTKQE